MRSTLSSVISPSSNSPEAEAELTSEPLRALRRGLTHAAGFSLYIAVVKNPAQRNQLISLLQEAIPGTRLQTVSLRADTTDILDEVHNQLGTALSGPIMIVGLEEAISTEAAAHPILAALNLRRPDWPKLIHQPVVLWVPEYLLGVLSRGAPDFLDWRSDTLHFPEVEAARLQEFHSTSWAGGADTRMPVAARNERVKELESRIATNEHSRDPVVLTTVVDWLNELGLHLNFLGRTQQAFRCFENCLALSRKIGSRRGESAALGNLGTTHFLLGNLHEAIEYCQQALNIDREIGHRLGESQNLGSLGVSYANLGDLQKAIELFEQGRMINRQIGYRRGEGISVGNLASANLAMGDAYKAAELYKQQLVIVREVGDRQGESNALGNLGIAYLKMGQLQTAAEFCEQSLLINREIGNRRGEAADLGNLGLDYSLLGNSFKALELYEKQLMIAREIGDRRSEGNSLFNSALVLDQLKDRAQAIARIENAVIILEAIKDPNIAKVREKLAEWQGTRPSILTLAENLQK